jgi:hypothetical protein
VLIRVAIGLAAAFFLAGCAAAVKQPGVAKDYLRIAAPYELVSASADVQSALDDFVRSDKVAPDLRSSSVSTARRGDGREAVVIVLVFSRSAVNSPGYLDGFVDGLAGGSPITRLRIGTLDTTGFLRGGLAGLVWVDGDTVVAIRGADPTFVIDVAQAIVRARQSIGVPHGHSFALSNRVLFSTHDAEFRARLARHC